MARDMIYPEDDVIADIDALVDWELTESPAAVVQQTGGGELAELVAYLESALSMFGLAGNLAELVSDVLSMLGALATSDETRELFTALGQCLEGEQHD